MKISVRKISEYLGHRSAVYVLADTDTPNHIYSGSGDGYLVEWDEQQPELGKAVASVEEPIYSILPLTKLEKTVVGTMNGGIYVVDNIQTSRTRNIRQHNRKGVFALKFYQNQIISIGGDGILTRWNLEKWLPSESIQLSPKALRSIFLIEKEDLWVVGASDGNLYFLDAQTLNLKKVIENAHQQSIFSLTMLPEQNMLVSGGRDAMLNVWDIENNFSKTTAIAAHLYTINDLKISPCKKWLASASRDKTIKIWDAKNLQLLKVIDSARHDGHRNSVNHLLWLNTKLWSCGDDRSIKTWEIKPETP